jgi:hypothetical protein
MLHLRLSDGTSLSGKLTFLINNKYFRQSMHSQHIYSQIRAVCVHSQVD